MDGGERSLLRQLGPFGWRVAGRVCGRTDQVSEVEPELAPSLDGARNHDAKGHVRANDYVPIAADQVGPAIQLPDVAAEHLERRRVAVVVADALAELRDRDDRVVGQRRTRVGTEGIAPVGQRQGEDPIRCRKSDFLGHEDSVGCSPKVALLSRNVNRVMVWRMIVIAHNIRSLHNIGSIFRNAAAFGVEKLYLTGYTAPPPRKEIAKVALGAQDLVDWQAGEIGEVIAELKRQGYSVWGLETGEGAVEISEIEISKLALVLGSEVEGIDATTLKLLDGITEIPMAKKRSLNVSVASGIAMYLLSSK